jgi:hypothetical protein
MARFPHETLAERFRIASSNLPMVYRKAFTYIFMAVDGCCRVSISMSTLKLSEIKQLY